MVFECQHINREDNITMYARYRGGHSNIKEEKGISDEAVLRVAVVAGRTIEGIRRYDSGIRQI